MTRTEKLFTIFVILLVSFTAYIFYLNKDSIIKVVNAFIMKFKEQEITIPYDKTINHKDYIFTSFKETNNFKPNNINDIKNIYYTVLNNGWNEFTLYCPNDYDNCANDVRTVANDNIFLAQTNNYVSPYNSYKKYNTLITNDKEIHLSIDKLYTDDDILKVNNKINEIFNELEIKNNKEENIKKLHDYLIKNTKYDEEYVEGMETTSNKATGTLFNNIALCSGYADTFSLMLDKLNIPNFKISNNEHVWNVLLINNEWKHIDVTWDDDERNKNNYYNFYLLNTNVLLEKDNDIHSFNKDIYLELK